MKLRNSIMSACDLINATVHFNPNTDDKRKFSPHTILQEVYPIAVPCYITRVVYMGTFSLKTYHPPAKKLLWGLIRWKKLAKPLWVIV